MSPPTEYISGPLRPSDTFAGFVQKYRHVLTEEMKQDLVALCQAQFARGIIWDGKLVREEDAL